MRPEKLYLIDTIEAADAIGRFCSSTSIEALLDNEMH